MIDSQVEKQELGRAKNAVQDHLIRKLLFPKVYLDSNWNGVPVEVIAIDRAGMGDVHIVKFVIWESGHTDNHGYSSFLEKTVFAEVDKFKKFQVHFSYIAIICLDDEKRPWIPSKEFKNHSLADDGVGRVGVLFVDLTEDDPTVTVTLKAERFRSSKEIVELADKFVAEHVANWEFRE